MRRDSSLAPLTPDQLADLYDWISADTYAEVIKRVAEPPPAGFGIKTHITTLCRFYCEERERRHCQALVARRAADTQSPGGDELIAEASRQLAHASYEMSQGPLKLANFNNLSRALHRRETSDLRRSQIEINRQQLLINKERIALEQKRLDLETRQFEYHAVEEAAKHAVKLKEIAADSSLNDRQKYSLARDVLFGPPPDSTTKDMGRTGASPIQGPRRSSLATRVDPAVAQTSKAGVAQTAKSAVSQVSNLQLSHAADNVAIERGQSSSSEDNQTSPPSPTRIESSGPAGRNLDSCRNRRQEILTNPTVPLSPDNPPPSAESADTSEFPVTQSSPVQK